MDMSGCKAMFYGFLVYACVCNRWEKISSNVNTKIGKPYVNPIWTFHQNILTDQIPSHYESTNTKNSNSSCLNDQPECLVSQMYWTDLKRQSVEVSELDGSNRRVLFTDLHKPRGIVTHYPSGKLFWADWGLPGIEVSDMDGNGRWVDQLIHWLVQVYLWCSHKD